MATLQDKARQSKSVALFCLHLVLRWPSRRAVRGAPVPGSKRKRRNLASRPPLAHQGSGDTEEGSPMGKLRLEASWCRSTCNTGQVLLELDLMSAYLLVKLVAVALAL